MTILCISGTPGTGKTIVSQLLARKLGWKRIGLNHLAKTKKLFCGYDRKRKAYIVDTDLVAKEVKRLARRRKNLILESHYAHELDCDVLIMLRTNPRELRKRMKAKQWSAEKIKENIEAEIMEVCLSEAQEWGRKPTVIDTTGKRPGQVVKEIITILQLK